ALLHVDISANGAFLFRRVACGAIDSQIDQPLASFDDHPRLERAGDAPDRLGRRRRSETRAKRSALGLLRLCGLGRVGWKSEELRFRDLCRDRALNLCIGAMTGDHAIDLAEELVDHRARALLLQAPREVTRDAS